VDVGEILFCNLILTHNHKEYHILNVVYKHNNDYIYDRKYIIDRLNLKDVKELKIKSIEVIKSLGFENKEKDYLQVKRSNEKRNTTTGAYD
jgi:hypothetical protein